MVAKRDPEKTWLIAKIVFFILLPLYFSTKSLDTLDHERSFCLFKNIFGHECWSCGMFKATIACLQLDFARAFHYNVLIIIVFPLLVYLWGKELFLDFRGLRNKK